jgi:hypothetical protein
MPERRHLKQSSTLEYRLTQEASNLRTQAQGMPDGVRRDELLRKAEQMDAAIHFDRWLSNPGVPVTT